jgi:hypothetical protein
METVAHIIYDMHMFYRYVWQAMCVYMCVYDVYMYIVLITLGVLFHIVIYIYMLAVCKYVSK